MNNNDWDDYCWECTGYGDNYYLDEETGEYVCACTDCPENPYIDPMDE